MFKGFKVVFVLDITIPSPSKEGDNTFEMETMEPLYLFRNEEEESCRLRTNTFKTIEL